jgi:methyl-accepting chemotaxis protein
VILIAVITVTTYAYTYNQAKEALKDTIKNQLMQLSNIAASQLSFEQIDLLANIQAGDNDNPELKKINTIFYNIRKNDQDISEFYAMRKEADGSVVFVADDWMLDPNEEASAVGDPYTDYEPTLLDAFTGLSTASEDIYTDQWGTWLSGYAPLKDASGKTVAVLAVDMDVTVVQQKINFISSLIYYVIGFAIFAAGLIILFFSMTIVKDVKSMSKVAEKISAGKLDVELPVIKTKNEIYYLNESLKSMMSAISFLTDQVKK